MSQLRGEIDFYPVKLSFFEGVSSFEQLLRMKLARVEVLFELKEHLELNCTYGGCCRTLAEWESIGMKVLERDADA